MWGILLIALANGNLVLYLNEAGKPRNTVKRIRIIRMVMLSVAVFGTAVDGIKDFIQGESWLGSCILVIFEMVLLVPLAVEFVRDFIKKKK